LVLLFVFYTGCDASNTFVALTLLSVLAFTGLQLFSTAPQDNADGQQGHNFLTSAVVVRDSSPPAGGVGRGVLLGCRASAASVGKGRTTLLF